MANKHQKFERIAFVASDVPPAQEALAKLTAMYGNADLPRPTPLSPWAATA